MDWPLSSRQQDIHCSLSLDLNSLFSFSLSLSLSLSFALFFNTITRTYQTVVRAQSRRRRIRLGWLVVVGRANGPLINENATFAENTFLRFRIKFCYFNVISSESALNNLGGNRMKVFAAIRFFLRCCRCLISALVFAVRGTLIDAA